MTDNEDTEAIPGPNTALSSPEAQFKDRDVTCRECGATFPFTAGEQAFYQSRGFTNDPTRCPECRNARRGNRRSVRGEEEGARIVCAACGVITTVPFRPSGGKPVYCRDCYTVRS
jgi:CxxC-x17-CxxC domain-containing protein